MGLSPLCTWRDLYPMHKATNDLHRLGTRGLISQQAAQFLYFAPIELAEVRMDLEGWGWICLCQLALEGALAGFQFLELCTDAARIAVAFQNEGQGPIDAAGNLLQVLPKRISVLVPASTQPLHLFPEAGCELGNQIFAPEEDILQGGSGVCGPRVRLHRC